MSKTVEKPKPTMSSAAHSIAREASGAVGFTIPWATILQILAAILPMLLACGVFAALAVKRCKHPNRLTVNRLQAKCEEFFDTATATIVADAILSHGADMTQAEMELLLTEAKG